MRVNAAFNLRMCVANVIIAGALRRFGVGIRHRIADFDKPDAPVPTITGHHVNKRKESVATIRPEPAAVFPVAIALPLFVIPVLIKK